MRIKKYFKYQTLLVLLFAALLIFIGKLTKGEGEEFLITEIMYNPLKDSPEWIELVAKTDVNNSKKSASCSKDCQLKDFYVCTKVSKSDSSCLSSYPVYAVGSKIDSIKKGDFIVITKDPESFAKIYDDYAGILLKANFNLLENENASLSYSLDNKNTWKGILFYADFFNKKEDGRSLERIDFDDERNSSNNWQESFSTKGTPGSKSSVKQKYEQKIYINEIYPHLKNKDEKEYVELYNSTDKDQILDGWRVEDKVGKKCLLDKKIIKANEYLILIEDSENDCDIALNDTSEEIVYLMDPNDDISHQTHSYKSAKEGISYSFDGASWHWSMFLTPGKENIFENIPKGKLVIDEDIYENVYADFVIKGLSKKAKVSWDFGDGHKSYKQKTRHKYKKKGVYNGSVKFSEGSEDVINNFKIKVEEFPHPKVKIIIVNANPEGSDTKNETITIQNKSKKEINLNGWSIATGWKKFVNHPISEDVEIKKNKSKEITREVSSFTLNNKKDKIELRYPDGEVAYKLKYKKEEGIDEGEVYTKVEGGWEWKKTENHESRIMNQDRPEGLKNASLSIDLSAIEDRNTIGNMQNKNTEISAQSLEGEIEVGGIVAEDNQENKFISMNNENIEIELLKSNPRALGVEDVRIVDDQYLLIREAPEQEHYASVFFEDISLNANAKLNHLLNLLFQ